MIITLIGGEVIRTTTRKSLTERTTEHGTIPVRACEITYEKIGTPGSRRWHLVFMRRGKLNLEKIPCRKVLRLRSEGVRDKQ